MRGNMSQKKGSRMISRNTNSLLLSLAMLLVGCATGGGSYDTPEEASQARLLELEKLIRERPDDPELYYEKGNTHFDLQQFAEAVTAYERVLELAPETPKALTNLGLSLRQLNRIDDALAAYQKSLTYDPDDAITLRNLKAVLEIKEDTELLVETTGRLAALDQRNENLQREYADLLFNMQDYVAAAEAFQNVIAINADLVEDWYAIPPRIKESPSCSGRSATLTAHGRPSIGANASGFISTPHS
jgi:tetratricopeptide (TPR) repeat protein